MGISRNIKSFFKKIKKVTFLENELQKRTVEMHLNTSDSSLAFPVNLSPEISIIVVAENNRDFTINCLNHLKLNLENDLSYEIILINTLRTNFDNLKGIRCLNVEENSNKIQNINQSIELTKGEFIYLISDNFVVQKNFLEELLIVFENFDTVGAVGSKLISDKGKLLEAGGLILRNGQAIVVANNKKPYSPDISYCYKTDFCSGNLLFKKINADGKINQFDDSYTEIRAAIVDFCFRIKQFQGKEIYFSGFSEIIQLKTNPTNVDSFTFSENDFTYFNSKWKKELTTITAVKREERFQEIAKGKLVVIFCGMIPEHDKDSGSNRLKEIIFGFKDLGHQVILISKNTYKDNHYIAMYQHLGVNVFYEYEKFHSVASFLKNQKVEADLVWFYSPNVFMKYYKLAKKYLPGAKLVYDMVDIHHLRYERAMQLEPRRISLKKKYVQYKKIEFKAAKLADVVIPISDFEFNYMEPYCGASKMIILSNIHYPKIEKEKTNSFENRDGILFIGSTHTPNIDALYFLYHEIMPIVWDELPEVKVNIIGNVNEVINDLNHPNFNFQGYVPNIEQAFISNKLMIAPLRYGAGVKGKIGQAFEYYLPVVTTSVGAEGMKLTNEINALLSDDKNQLAAYIIELYRNKTLWQKLQDNSENSLEPFSKKTLKNSLQKILS